MPDPLECRQQNVCITPKRIECDEVPNPTGFKKYVCLIDDSCPLLEVNACKGPGCDVLAGEYAKKHLRSCDNPEVKCKDKSIHSEHDANPREDPHEKCTVMKGKGDNAVCPYYKNGCIFLDSKGEIIDGRCSMLNCGFAVHIWIPEREEWECRIAVLNACASGWENGPNFWKGHTGTGSTDRGTFLKHANTASVVVVFPDGNVEVYAEKCLKLFSKESIQIRAKKNIIMDACGDICIKSGNQTSICSKNIVEIAEEQHRIKAWETVVKSNSSKICVEDFQLYAREKIRIKGWHICHQAHTMKSYTCPHDEHWPYHSASDESTVAPSDWVECNGLHQWVGGEERIKAGLVKKPICPRPPGEPIPDIEPCTTTINCSCLKGGKITPYLDDEPLSESTCVKTDSTCETPSSDKPYVFPPKAPIQNTVKRGSKIKLIAEPINSHYELDYLIVDGEYLGPKKEHEIKYLKNSIDVYGVFKRKRVVARILTIDKVKAVPSGDVIVKSGCTVKVKYTIQVGWKLINIIIGPHIISIPPKEPYIIIPPITGPIIRPIVHPRDPVDPIVTPPHEPEIIRDPIVPIVPRDPVIPYIKEYDHVQPIIPPDGPLQPYYPPITHHGRTNPVYRDGVDHYDPIHIIPDTSKDPNKVIDDINNPITPYTPYNPDDPYNPYAPYDPDNPSDPNNPYNPQYPYHPLTPPANVHQDPIISIVDLPITSCGETMEIEEEDVKDPIIYIDPPKEGEIIIEFQEIRSCITITPVIIPDEPDVIVNPKPCMIKPTGIDLSDLPI